MRRFDDVGSEFTYLLVFIGKLLSKSQQKLSKNDDDIKINVRFIDPSGAILHFISLFHFFVCLLVSICCMPRN